MTPPSFPTKAEADAHCREQEKATGKKWFSRETGDGAWEAIGSSLPAPASPLGSAVESKPRPEQPGDPRDGKPNPNWGF